MRRNAFPVLEETPNQGSDVVELEQLLPSLAEEELALSKQEKGRVRSWRKIDHRASKCAGSRRGNPSLSLAELAFAA